MLAVAFTEQNAVVSVNVRANRCHVSVKKSENDSNLKATVIMIVTYTVGTGLFGAYWATKCGPHWFMYVVSFSPIAVPALFLIWVGAGAAINHYAIGGRRSRWLIVAACGALIFIASFVYAHLLPDTPFYDPNDCNPW
jgi:hypothetical protein